MKDSNREWIRRTAGRGVWTICLVLLVAGCRTRKSGDRSLLERLESAGHRQASPKPGELAEKGRAEITDECAKQSFETASKGLIVSEIGLHEDVFMLRDLVSYGSIGYSLDEALRLESMLRAEVGRQTRPAEQAACIERFAEHLEALSDPLVEGDQRLKELDATAFKDAAKEADRQTEERLRAADKAAESPQN